MTLIYQSDEDSILRITKNPAFIPDVGDYVVIELSVYIVINRVYFTHSSNIYINLKFEKYAS
jgi:hypothetical protein